MKEYQDKVMELIEENSLAGIPQSEVGLKKAMNNILRNREDLCIFKKVPSIFFPLLAIGDSFVGKSSILICFLERH